MDIQARHVLFSHLTAAGLSWARCEKAKADMGTPVTLGNLIIHKLWGIDYDKNSEFVDDLHMPDIVYHYTSRDTAVAITDAVIKSVTGDGSDSCGFAFSNYRFLNDRREYDLGIDFAMDWVPKYNGFPEGLKRQIIEEVAKHKESFAPYVLSFCQQQDSTSQWQIYTGKEGGYAIGLDVHKLKEEVDRFVGEATGNAERRFFKKGTAAMFMPCIYWPPEKEWKAKEKFNENLSEALGRFFDGITDYWWDSKGKENYHVCASWCAMRILQFASFVKSNEFRHEKEWRLVLRPKMVEDKDARIIAGRPMVTPRTLNLGKCISEIVVSPHGDKDRLRLLAEFQMARAGISVAMVESKSSYSGH